jgi:predicted RecB family nuclease
LSPKLSKSRFLAGLQCPLRLWYQCYNRNLATPPDPMQQALFDSGHQVGRLATERYPGGILIEEDYRHHEKAVKTTIHVMEDGVAGAIFEAAYTEEGVRIRADILERRPGRRWNLIEVKSSTKVKEEYLTDVAVQCHVLKRAGVDLERAYLMHIDRDYVFEGGRTDLQRFLMLEDLTDDAIRLQDFVQENLDELKNMLSMDHPPDINPSRHCHHPHTCEFWAHCTRNKPRYWILELPGIRQERFNALFAMGIHRIDEIPEAFPMTDLQQRSRDCIVESREYISSSLGEVLSDVMYPVHFLDFETVMPAIPRYAGTRPYQTIPFQWSDHILQPDDALAHNEFLFEEDRDPMPEFTRTLLDVLGRNGTIIIYTTYEQRILKDLAEQFSRYAEELEALQNRFVDLCAVIKKHFYHPEFHGSFSLKSTLPAIVPEMDYNHLAIQEGGLASLEYLRMIDAETPEREKRRIRSNLLAYCAQDTLAMVRIREVLLEKAKTA